MSNRIITKAFLKNHKACRDGCEYWLKTGITDLSTFLRQCLIDNHFDYANWLIVRTMKRKQYLAYAIFAAEQVLPIFEAKYPTDDGPGKAIDATKAVLQRDTKKNRDAAVDAAYAASAAYAAAAAASAASAAYAAAYAAYAADAADAADAAVDAVDAVDAADAAVDAADAAEEMKARIIEYGIKIIESENR